MITTLSHFLTEEFVVVHYQHNFIVHVTKRVTVIFKFVLYNIIVCISFLVNTITKVQVEAAIKYLNDLLDASSKNRTDLL